MIDWRTLKKIDAHIHILPDAVHAANPDSDDAWAYAGLDDYASQMARRGIEQAVIMPLNDPWLMSMEFTVDAVHKNLAEMKRRYPGKFFAFADVDVRNTPQQSVEAIRRAVDEYGLDGIKLHPNNAGVPLDAEYNRPILAFAEARGLPVAIHCYPNSEHDLCTARQVVEVLKRFPKLTAIVCHMGAYQWEELLPTRAYLDLSAILPDYIEKLGIAQTNALLRRFGAERLLFASDYPDSRILPSQEIYPYYFDVLGQADFTPQEAQTIAHDNWARIFANKNREDLK